MTISAKSKTTSIKLDAALSDKVASLALRRRRAPHTIMREAISQYVEREAIREAAIKDAKASWESYQQTGKHITLNEFDAWVGQLEKDPAAPMPACHK